jgi:hypothetical protein
VLLAAACEALARRIVHQAGPENLAEIMSNRYQHRQVDGDASEMSSALELAIDQHWYVIGMTKVHALILLPVAPSSYLRVKRRMVRRVRGRLCFRH